MVNYGCTICKKIFTQKGHLEAHQNRKRPCKKDNTIEMIVEQKMREFLAKAKLDTPEPHDVASSTMEYDKQTREELISHCKEKGIKGYSGKKKAVILLLLGAPVVETPTPTPSPSPSKIHRLNYIGSKFQLLDWITDAMKGATGWSSFADKTVADLFAGTGIVSHHFRNASAKVVSNDAELYSSIITHAFTRSVYTDACRDLIDEFQKSVVENKHASTVGFVTTHYSPHGVGERKFFTVENAKRIDYIRNQLELRKSALTEDDYAFVLASLLLSADAVSNVPAVYGCFLKNFKAKATKNLTLAPIHTITTPAVDGSTTHNSNVLDTEFLDSFTSDVVYLDPPYNERQYSKNYFPLNIIAKTPEELLSEPPLKGKTGIPTDCFISPFCQKGDRVEKAFDLLFSKLQTKWIFLSYNSESIVSREKMLEIMAKYGTPTVLERDYKRFKSFEYNKDIHIKEYLFCLHKV